MEEELILSRLTGHPIASAMFHKEEARLQPGFKESTHSTQFGHSAGRIPWLPWWCARAFSRS